MENPNSRGQGTIEVSILLLMLSALVLAAMKFSKDNRNYIPTSQLSQEIK